MRGCAVRPTPFLDLGLPTPLEPLNYYPKMDGNHSIGVDSKEPRPAGRGFCKPRGNLSPLRYELPFLPALPSGASWQIFVNSTGYPG